MKTSRTRMVITLGASMLLGASASWLSRSIFPSAQPQVSAPSTANELPMPPTPRDWGKEISLERSPSRQFALAAEWQPPHGTAGLLAWLDQVAKLTNSDLREFLHSSAASKLSTSHLKDLVLHRGLGNHEDANAAVIREWVQRIGVAALGEAGTEMLTNWSLVQACAQADPRGTLDFARKHPELFAKQPDGPSELIYYAVDNWPPGDKNQLSADLNSLPAAWRKTALRWLTQFQPDEALASLIALPAGERTAQATGILNSLESKDPGGDLDQLMRDAPDIFNTFGWQSLLGKWSDQDPRAALTWLDAHAGDLRGSDLRSMKAQAASRLALTDADAAYDIAGSLTNRENSHPVVDTAADLARSDPGAALRWLEKVPQGQDRSSILYRLNDWMTDASPEILTKLLAGLPPDTPASTRTSLTDRLTELTTGPPDLSMDAGAWLKSAIDPDGTLNTDPNNIRQGCDSPLDALLNRFAGSPQPEAAETWIAALPDPALAAAVAARHTWHLMLNDPARADTLLNSLPQASPLRAGITAARQEFQTMLSGGKP